MTYLESYRQCATVNELIKKIKYDVHIALILNPDRIKPIEDAMNNVANERHWNIPEGIDLNAID